MLLSLANWWHSLFNIMSAFGIYSSPITVVSRCYQQAALRCIWMLMSGLFGTRKWNSLEVRGFILAKDLLTSPLCHVWWCRIPVHPLLGHIRNKAAYYTVQQQPPPGTFSISPAFVIRGVWDTILQWDISECHHYLEQTLEHSNQTFRYLIQTQNSWERERRGANFQADFQVKYLPNINEVFLVEFTAVSHGIINCMRFCTCGRWNWPLGSAAEREVVLCTLRATSECQNCSQLWQTDTKQLSSTFVQNLSLLQYINRKNMCLRRIIFSFYHLAYSFHLWWLYSPKDTMFTKMFVNKNFPVWHAGPLGCEPSAGPVGLWDSSAQGFNNSRAIRNKPQIRVYLLPSPTGGKHRSCYLQ